MNKKQNKLIIICIALVLIVTLAVILGIINNKNSKLKEFVIETAEKDIEEGDKLTVNKVVMASKKLEIYELKIRVKNGKLYINDKLKEIEGETIDTVTGYYYQPTDVYNLFVLTKNNKIYNLPNIDKHAIDKTIF